MARFGRVFESRIGLTSQKGTSSGPDIKCIDYDEIKKGDRTLCVSAFNVGLVVPRP